MALLQTLAAKGQKVVRESLLGLLARIALAATFWLSGQSKVEGLTIDILGGEPLRLGIPHLSSGALALFATEYQLPLLPPAIAATLAAVAEHLFPLLLLLGLATRFSALALWVMTLVIQIFVYPDAWPVHSMWMSVQIYLMSYGGGKLALDSLLCRRRVPRSNV
ncbi:TQO small subunit DoxD family protein [Serratia sp. MYb239]|uniref:DoxX family membrane protein n=1 Tax=Serratia sp. MYb239 TaxID=2033438 RepID=UPI000CF5EC36|nr:DoxX family membrane protein [Serratia sp. MYb239]AVJ19237.1 TQO small subunit DoxD family protein [Serratia sp. MYb239]